MTTAAFVFAGLVHAAPPEKPAIDVAKMVENTAWRWGDEKPNPQK